MARQPHEEHPESGSWRDRVHEVIFEADTPTGKFFDITLLIFIFLSVVVVMLESITEIRLEYGDMLTAAEWFFTIVFSIEYILRLVSVHKPSKYAWSFFGVIDLISILPTYLSLVFAGSQFLLVFRAMRLLRIFRVFKMVRYINGSREIIQGLRRSFGKILVFFMFLIMIALIMGSIMYLVEGEERGFNSIPKSMYWAIVTMTTVGYGDITPGTPVGQLIASILMIMGYAIIAVPTGIATVEIARTTKESVTTQVCKECNREGHDANAAYCKFCGEPIT